jgi:hypothetical protein
MVLLSPYNFYVPEVNGKPIRLGDFLKTTAILVFQVLRRPREGQIYDEQEMKEIVDNTLRYNSHGSVCSSLLSKVNSLALSLSLAFRRTVSTKLSSQPLSFISLITPSRE